MDGKELIFCEEYEKNLDTYDMLNVIKDSLSPKAYEGLVELRIWLMDNLSKYLELIG